MNPYPVPARETVNAEKRTNGLIAGVLAGLGFALAAWGYDGVMLARAQAELPFLKLALGLLPCLLIAGLAGYLSARYDSGLLAFIFWLLAGCVMTWLVSHLPFEGVSAFIRLTEPGFRGITAYPFVLGARVRMTLLYLVIGLLSGLFGIFFLFLIESATRAADSTGRWFNLALSIPLILFAGLAADNLINQPFRTPIIIIDRLIRLELNAENQPVSEELARSMHLRALDPLKDLLHQPRKLALGDYDPQSLSASTVIVRLPGANFSCSMIEEQTTYCPPTYELYLDNFTCLLSQPAGSDCDIQVSEAAGQQLASLASQAVQIGFLSQRGTAVLLVVQDKNNQRWICYLHKAELTSLEGCQPAPAGLGRELALQPFATAMAPQAETGTPTPTSSPQIGTGAPTSGTVQTAAEPASLLQPFAQPEAASLTSAPVYTITVSVDYPNHTFQGHETVKYTNAEEVSLDRLYFRLFPNGQKSYGNGSLTTSQVGADGQPVETQLSFENSTLEVQLPGALQPGQQTRIDMDFNGLVPVDFGGTATPAGYGIYNFTNGVLALSGWYPILAVYEQGGWDLDPVSAIGDSVYSDTGFYTVDLSTAADLVVAATGIATQRQTTQDTTHYRFSSGPVRDFTMVMSPDFQVASRTVDSTLVNSYYLPGHEAGGEKALSVAADSFHIYNQHFGPYPFTELDVVDTPMRNASGVEYPGIVLISDNLYNDPQSPYFIVTVAHEVAHQWWYSTIGDDVIDEPWLDEALTTYSSSLYYEFKQGSGAAQGLYSYWQGRYQTLVQQSMDDQVTQTLTHFENLDPRIYGGIVYSKGALFFRALRQEIGDDAFFKALQTYYQDYRFKITTGKDLLNAFEQAAGRSLESLYQEWLYSPKQ